MLLAVAATVGLPFPPLSSKPPLVPPSLLFGPIPWEMGCRYLLDCWVQAALRVDIFLAETRKSTAQANYDVT